MLADVSDLRSTIVPKSDQLNAEQLLGGPMTLTVADVRIGSDDQPVVVHYTGEDGRPFKPCKTMRKLLIFAWGEDGRKWVGKSMTVYNDPAVRFGGMDVGGIRISHLSDIPQRIKVSLTATKGKKSMYEVDVLKVANPAERINAATTVEALKAAFGAAYKANKDATTRATLKAAYDARMAELAPPAFDLADAVQRIELCSNRDDLALLADELRTAAPDEAAKAAVSAEFNKRDDELAGE